MLAAPHRIDWVGRPGARADVDLAASAQTNGTSAAEEPQRTTPHGRKRRRQPWSDDQRADGLLSRTLRRRWRLKRPVARRAGPHRDASHHAFGYRHLHGLCCAGRRRRIDVQLAVTAHDAARASRFHGLSRRDQWTARRRGDCRCRSIGPRAAVRGGTVQPALPIPVGSRAIHRQRAVRRRRGGDRLGASTHTTNGAGRNDAAWKRGRDWLLPAARLDRRHDLARRRSRLRDDSLAARAGSDRVSTCGPGSAAGSSSRARRSKRSRSWAVHPGGPRILSAVEESLALPPHATSISRQVLAELGNMSSPTVLFIIERMRAAQRHALASPLASARVWLPSGAAGIGTHVGWPTRFDWIGTLHHRLRRRPARRCPIASIRRALLN